MAITEREKHIKVLEQFLHDYQEWGEDLELEKTIKYAIYSLKTDETYQLMYEGEDVYTKDEVKAMFEELRKECEKEAWRLECLSDGIEGRAVDLVDVNYLIVQKINALKENTE